MEMPFDRRAKRLQRERAAPALEQHDFLLREVAARLGERLAETEKHFARALVLGGGTVTARALAPFADVVVHGDGAAAMAPDVVIDEELQPFAAQSFDLIVSALTLHWVNDLPGALVQIRRALKPDGLFLGALFGGETLRELRTALLTGEAEVRGGASPRVAPMVDVRDAGDLLQRTGFFNPVADIDAVTVTYADPLQLMAELRGMGEANALAQRLRHFTARSTLLAAAAAYREQFAAADGRVPATFQIVTLTGWAPPPHTPPAPAAAERPPAAAPPRRLRRA